MCQQNHLFSPVSSVTHLSKREQDAETISRHMERKSPPPGGGMRQLGSRRSAERQTAFTLAAVQRCSDLLTVGQVCSSKSIDLHLRRVGKWEWGVHARRRVWSDGTNHFWHLLAHKVKSNLLTPYQGIWNKGDFCPRCSPNWVSLTPLESA